ncbi:MAG: alpha/beta fold hydrolase [Pseudomonadota bacterium]
MKSVSFETKDEVTLNGFLIEASAPRGVSIIHGATGVPMGYYKAFAQWLSSERKHHVLIYGYRDSELKKASSLRRSRSNMSDWGIRDQSAALDFALSQFPDLPVHTIGHSLGGMCLPYHQNADQIKSHVAINAGPAYWRNHPWHFLPQVVLFWFVLGPVATWLFGYMPGKLIGFNADLPANVYWQWRRWCSNPNFYEVDWGHEIKQPVFSRIKCEVQLIGTEDDVMIPPSQVQKLSKYFPEASIGYKTISPSKLGLKAIGHIGIFSPRNQLAWPELIR